MHGRGALDLDALYQASYRRLVVQMYAICGDLVDAEDAVQEAFVTAVRKRRQLEGVGNHEAWLRTVAVNRLVGLAARRRRTAEAAAGARVTGAGRGRTRPHGAVRPETLDAGARMSSCCTTSPTSGPRRSRPSSASPRAP